MFKQSSWPVCGTVKAWEWIVVFQLAKLEFENVTFTVYWTLGNISQKIQWDLVAYIVNSEFSIFEEGREIARFLKKDMKLRDCNLRSKCFSS